MDQEQRERIKALWDEMTAKRKKNPRVVRKRQAERAAAQGGTTITNSTIVVCSSNCPETFRDLVEQVLGHPLRRTTG